jgi:hypothetical protein
VTDIFAITDFRIQKICRLLVRQARRNFNLGQPTVPGPLELLAAVFVVPLREALAEAYYGSAAACYAQLDQLAPVHAPWRTR